MCKLIIYDNLAKIFNETGFDSTCLKELTKTKSIKKKFPFISLDGVLIKIHLKKQRSRIEKNIFQLTFLFSFGIKITFGSYDLFRNKVNQNDIKLFMRMRFLFFDTPFYCKVSRIFAIPLNGFNTDIQSYTKYIRALVNSKK